jgi:hypothetical protein
MDGIGRERGTLLNGMEGNELTRESVPDLY